MVPVPVFSVIYVPEHILRDFTAVAFWLNPDRQSAPLTFIMVAYKLYEKVLTLTRTK